MYTESNRALQDAFDTRRLADRIAERLVGDTLGPSDQEFITRADMMFLATADENGKPQCSYKGGDPGFVKVVDERTIAFPSYDGNGMFLSLGNIDSNAQIGLLFIDFQRQRRLRVNGVAAVFDDDPLLADYPEAQLLVRVGIGEVFPNCPRYIHKMQLVERSRYVPRKACRTPTPDWKRAEWAVDVLPPGADGSRLGRQRADVADGTVEPLP